MGDGGFMRSVQVEQGAVIAAETLGQARVIELEHGPLEYYDTGDGEPLLFFHEWPASAETWRGVIGELAPRYRCIAPRWPYGVHRIPINRAANLGPLGIAAMTIELLDAVGIDKVTLVGSGGGGALCEVVGAAYPERVARLAVSTGDAFNHWPAPRLWPFAALAYMPPVSWLFLQALRVRPLLRASYSIPCKRVPPDDILRAYLDWTLASSGVRRDIRRGIRALRPRYGLDAAEHLREFAGPILIVWGSSDLLFPVSYAKEMAAMWPTSRLVLLEDLRTFIGEDQPHRYAELLDELMQSPAPVAAAQAAASS